MEWPALSPGLCPIENMENSSENIQNGREYFSDKKFKTAIK